MPEDQLTHDERLRLEAVNQSNALNAGGHVSSTKLVQDAAAIEAFIRGDDSDKAADHA